MKRYPTHIPRERALAPLRIPQFHAVHLRARDDGWTPQRQAEFIGHLAQTRSVTQAARAVGMARETAYRLRRGEWSESFCAAWDIAIGDAALGNPMRKGTAGGRTGMSQGSEPAERKVTNAELYWRVQSGLWQLKFYRGTFRMAWRKGDDSALFRLLARLDRAKPSHAARTADGGTLTPRAPPV